MKKDKIKFSIFCLIVFCIVSLPVSQIILLGYVPDTSSVYSFYTIDNVCQIANANVVKNGNSCIVTCDSTNASMVRKCLTKVLGESVQINNPTDKTLKHLNNKIKDIVLFSEIVDDSKIIYCYDGSLQNFVMLNEQKVNLQIAINKNYVVVGYPLILGSF